MFRTLICFVAQSFLQRKLFVAHIFLRPRVLSSVMSLRDELIRRYYLLDEWNELVAQNLSARSLRDDLCATNILLLWYLRNKIVLCATKVPSSCKVKNVVVSLISIRICKSNVTPYLIDSKVILLLRPLLIHKLLNKSKSMSKHYPILVFLQSIPSKWLKLRPQKMVMDILKQKANPNQTEKIVRFHSGIWTRSQRNYSTIKKELLEIFIL